MFDNLRVWIAALAIVAAAVGYALWRGRSSEVSLGPEGLSVRTKEPEQADHVVVARSADVGGEVGDITGISGEDARADRRAEVDVASKMVVRPGARISAITGIALSGAPSEEAGGRNAEP